MKHLLYIACAAIVFTGCKDGSAEQARLQQQHSLDSMQLVMQQQQAELARQKSIDSVNAAALAAKETEAQRASTTVHHVHHVTHSGEYVTSTGNAAAAAPQKKGWSGAAKGTVIGAGVGAISGALIDKRRGEGAIIGGLAGAGIGAGTGAVIDASKKKKGK